MKLGPWVNEELRRDNVFMLMLDMRASDFPELQRMGSMNQSRATVPKGYKVLDVHLLRLAFRKQEISVCSPLGGSADLVSR